MEKLELLNIFLAAPKNVETFVPNISMTYVLYNLGI